MEASVPCKCILVMIQLNVVGYSKVFLIFFPWVIFVYLSGSAFRSHFGLFEFVCVYIYIFLHALFVLESFIIYACFCVYSFFAIAYEKSAVTWFILW